MNRNLSVPSLLLGVTLLAGCGADVPIAPVGEGFLGEAAESSQGSELQSLAVAAAYCDDVLTWDASWQSFESQVLTLVNQKRAAGATCGGVAKPAAPALTLDTRLQCAARKHSKDMGTNNIFDHNGSDGSTPWQRITNAGYTYTAAGENIAAGYSTPSAVVNGWMASTGHCNNIMNPNFKHLGVGYFYKAGSTYSHYWTQDFGRQ
ncbi:CAP domain-containing protein [Vitiosangium sp. GDMCC 1.1324]|uniref:CAP domain-containing protein n=1 Tax=Vitiosangium sp. (strain GDMCC 1.1324) TaxID=2138576 RepID=UPI000D34D408|nr:CAP domain-containing protein [Vitiosangium sp. GDMCC 1.1324]PTL75295.1 CAP domain-containing protein [Vitiosangium sp. GDMCC 1.1324]